MSSYQQQTRVPRRTKSKRLPLIQIGSIIAASAIFGYLIGNYRQRRKIFPIKNTNNNRKHSIITTNNKGRQRILLFGDSTTWGYCPDTQKRLQTRYGNILQELLGDGYDIIQEGLNGRTIMFNDIDSDKNKRRGLNMNSVEQILPIIYSHKPIDIVVIMLGINDCKAKFNATCKSITTNMKILIEKVKNAEIWAFYRPKILLISPAMMGECNAINSEWGFDINSQRISKGLSIEYQKLADIYECVDFMNANDYIKTGSDGIHIDGKNNIILGNKLKNKIIEMINERNKKRKSLPVILTNGNVSKQIYSDERKLNNINEINININNINNNDIDKQSSKAPESPLSNLSTLNPNNIPFNDQCRDTDDDIDMNDERGNSNSNISINTNTVIINDTNSISDPRKFSYGNISSISQQGINSDSDAPKVILVDRPE